MIAAALILAASPPAAVGDVHLRLTEKPPTREALRVIYQTGICLARERPDMTRKLLEMDYNTDIYRKQLLYVADYAGQCMPQNGELRFSGSLMFAGPIAEQHYRVRYASKPFMVATAPILARDVTEGAALCSVRKAPDASRALLRTKLQSDAERTAVDALLPTFASCYPRGAQTRMVRSAVRALVALALYRLARHAEQAGTISSGSQ